MVQGSAFWTLIWSLDWRKIGRFYCFKATPSFTWESSVLDLSESLTSFIFLSWAELIQRNVGSFSSEHICGAKTDSIWFLTSVFLFSHFCCRFSDLDRVRDFVKTTGESLPGQGQPPDSARNWPRTWRLSDWRVCRPSGSCRISPKVLSSPGVGLGIEGQLSCFLSPGGILLW